MAVCRVRCLDIRQSLRDGAFRKFRRNRDRLDRDATRQAGQDFFHHRPHHHRHARHHKDVADLKSRRHGSTVLDQAGAIRNARHALARVIELALGIARFQRGIRLGVIADADAKGLGHRIGGDVVMGGADAARGENEIVPGPKRVQCRHDLGLDIAHHPDFLQVDAQQGKLAGDVIAVAVLGAARENFVTDHQHRGGFNHLVPCLR